MDSYDGEEHSDQKRSVTNAMVEMNLSTECLEKQKGVAETGYPSGNGAEQNGEFKIIQSCCLTGRPIQKADLRLNPSHSFLLCFDLTFDLHQLDLESLLCRFELRPLGRACKNTHLSFPPSLLKAVPDYLIRPQCTQP